VSEGEAMEECRVSASRLARTLTLVGTVIRRTLPIIVAPHLMDVCLMSVHLVGVHLMDVDLTGVHLMAVPSLPGESTHKRIKLHK
jgi:hypothetical protein